MISEKKLEIQILYSQLNSSLPDTITNELNKRYLNRILNYGIVTRIGTPLSISKLQVDTLTIWLMCEVHTIVYNKDDIVEGYLNIIENPPKFKSEHLKCSLDNTYTRNHEYIVSESNKEYRNDDLVKVKILQLQFIEGNRYIHGTVKLI